MITEILFKIFEQEARWSIILHIYLNAKKVVKESTTNAEGTHTKYPDYPICSASIAYNTYLHKVFYHAKNFIKVYNREVLEAIEDHFKYLDFINTMGTKRKISSSIVYEFESLISAIKTTLEKEAYELWTPILSGKRLYEFTKLSLDVKNNFLEPILIPLRNNFLHFSDRKPVNVIEGNVYIGSEKSKSIILDVDLNLQDAEYKGKKINTEFITIVKKVLDYYDVIHKLVIEELDSSLGIGENCEDRDRTYWKISFPPEKIQYNKDLIVRDFNIVDLNFL